LPALSVVTAIHIKTSWHRSH